VIKMILHLWGFVLIIVKLTVSYIHQAKMTSGGFFLEGAWAKSIIVGRQLDMPYAKMTG